MANKIKDFSGKKIDYLFVVERVGKNEQGNSMFLCLCDCGKYTKVSGNKLSSNRFHSCGCYKWNITSESRKEKVCSNCKFQKKIENFVKNKSRKDNHSQYCKECYKLIYKNYYKKYKNYYTSYRRVQRKKSINFKLADNIRRRINQALRKSLKSNNTLNLLGCSIDEFKKYLEKKFDLSMTWENYGSHWNIDHIRPCASFNLTDPDQQKLCFHFTNQQPMKKFENLSKNSLFKGFRYRYEK